MAAIDTSADGAYIFLALERSGQPIFVYAARTDLSTWLKAYEPAAGSAGNVVKVPANPDKMLFYGNFGADVGIIVFTISTPGTVDISPASLGSKVINTLWVNPSDEDEMIATVDTDQDLLYTSDGGTTWDTWDSALGFDATAQWPLWSGPYYPHRYFVGGEVGAGNLDVLYSPNEGESRDNKEDASLGGKADITNIEATEA